MTEDEIVGWHHCLSGCQFEQAPGDGEGQGSLVCYSPCGHKDSDRIERLNNHRIFSIFNIIFPLYVLCVFMILKVLLVNATSKLESLSRIHYFSVAG